MLPLVQPPHNPNPQANRRIQVHNPQYYDAIEPDPEALYEEDRQPDPLDEYYEYMAERYSFWNDPRCYKMEAGY